MQHHAKDIDMHMATDNPLYKVYNTSPLDTDILNHLHEVTVRNQEFSNHNP